MSDFFNYLAYVFSFDSSNPLLFTQFQFWAFFAFVFAGFAFFKNKKILRNSYLFFISLFFYYKTSGLFVGLLLLVTCTDFFIAKRIA
ncbi:MAG: MBOAT family protein, partial [Muribaculaceae bacterium]|nr:MBOAT family protein [Muribaculaceae bacterium]